MGERGPEPSESLLAAGARLRVDAAAAEVVREFERAGIANILLKGRSLAEWLYAPGEIRPYVDCDLLVPPADREEARRVLAELGFVPELVETDMPSWWREHAVGWMRSADGARVDLHRRISGVGVDEQRAWDILALNVEPIAVGGAPVLALTVPGRAMQLALHAAHHGRAAYSVLVELERALSQSEESIWRSAASLAASLQATSAFALGLRLVAPGREIADRIGLPTSSAADVALRGSWMPPQAALGFEQLAQAMDWRQRAQIIRYKALPPVTFMRHWSPLARRSRVGLVLAYIWRPLWLLRSAPEGFRAWHAARRRGG